MSVKKNFVYNLMYQILLVILPLVTAPYIARTLGAEGSGIYSYTNSVAYYFLLLAMMGIANHGNRSVAAVREDREKLNATFSGIFALQAATFLIALCAYAFYALFIAKDNRMIALLQILYVLSGLFDISWLFFGLEKFKITVGRNIAIKLVTVLCMFIFVHTPEDLWKYTLIMCGGTLISQVYLWFYVRRYVSFTRTGIKTVLGNLKPVLVLFIPVLAYSIYKVMDKIMLGNMSTYAQVGFYQNAEKITNIPMGVITALGTVMLPRMSNLVATGDAQKAKTYIHLSLRVVTMLCAAIAFGLMGISDVLANVYLGTDFAQCGPLIFLLSTTVFFVAWANVIRTQYLIPNHYDKIYITSTVVGAVLNLFINYALIPRYQARGAAIGTVIAEFAVMFIQVLAVRKQLPVGKYIKESIPVLVIGAMMMALVYGLGDCFGMRISTLVWQIGIGGAFFCGGLFAYLFFTKDELLMRVLRRKSI